VAVLTLTFLIKTMYGSLLTRGTKKPRPSDLDNLWATGLSRAQRLMNSAGCTVPQHSSKLAAFPSE